MCGRFTLTLDTEKLQCEFPWVAIPDGIMPRFNIAPTQPVAVISNKDPQRLDYYLWGLIPSWAKDPSIGSRMINARAETLTQKPSFRSAYLRRRCLILTDGFYEWAASRGKKTKQPYYFHMASNKPFAFAGLWDIWHAPDGSEVRSCAIITTPPNELLAPLHNRMPLILASHHYSLWLEDAGQSTKQLDALLHPYPATEMVALPVTTAVNRPDYDAPDCIAPLTLGGDA